MKAHLKSPEPNPTEPASPAVVSPTGKVSIASIPGGGDIEVDGDFVGNAPSDFQLPEGNHIISVKKTGIRRVAPERQSHTGTSESHRNVRVTPGANVHLQVELEKVPNSPN